MNLLNKKEVRPMEENLKVIVFQLDNEQYAVDLEQVLSIERLQTITHVPNTSTFIKGVINLRGEIIPIIDLKERLHKGLTKYTESTRLLIVQMNTLKVGLIVDTATDVIDLDQSQVEPAPSIFGGVTREYLKGVVKLEDQLFVLLDLKCVLNLEEHEQIGDVVQDKTGGM
jgi:purine-binding chemotaxis protein CheW